MEKPRLFVRENVRRTLVTAAAGLTAALLIVYAAFPVRVQAMPLVDVASGIGPMVISVPTIPSGPNDLPVEGAGVRTPTVQETLLHVCEAKGYGISCAKTLLGMMWKESLYDGHAIGDHGEARGYFQIHYRLHHISIACAEDLECSATWTLNYLEYNGYPRYPMYAVQCHNSCNAGNGYAASALRHGERMWSYDFTQGTALALNDPTR